MHKKFKILDIPLTRDKQIYYVINLVKHTLINIRMHPNFNCILFLKIILKLCISLKLNIVELNSLNINQRVIAPPKDIRFQ